MASITIFRKWLTRIALVCTVLGGMVAPSKGQIVINEVLFFDTTIALEVIRRYDWVELYNAHSDSINLKEWFLINRNLDTLYYFENDFFFPDSTYLMIHFAAGTDDTDFSDGSGSVYANPGPFDPEPLPYPEGSVALCSPDIANRAGATIPALQVIDFVPWTYHYDLYVPGPADTAAVNSGVWMMGDVVNAANTDKEGNDRRAFVGPGFSIGRDMFSTDSDKPEDWYAHGGIDASDITPWRINQSNGFVEFIPAPAPQPGDQEWTIMIYMAGDNKYEKYMWSALNAMDLVGSPPKVNVVVQKDYAKSGPNIHVSFDNGQTWTPTNSTYRGLLWQTKDSNLVRITYPPGQLDQANLGEKNMGDPATLTDFIIWTKANYPAKRYALILWGEGGGWKYCTTDNFGPGTPDELHIAELSSALENAGLAGEPLDLIAFDEGLMAMLEVAYQVNDYAEVMVAPEGVIDAFGFPYHKILQQMALNPATSAEELGERMVEQYELSESVFWGWVFLNAEYSMSSIDLGFNVAFLEESVYEHANELYTGCDDYREHYIPEDNVEISIREALTATKNFKEGDWGDCNYIDLYHFAENTQLYVPEYASFAPLVQQDVKIAVLYNRSSDPNANGISIYFPYYQTDDIPEWQDPYDDPFRSYKTSAATGNPVKYSYDKDDGYPKPFPEGVRDHPIPPTPGFKFVDINSWDEFLHRYYEPCADAGEDKAVYVGEVVTLDGIGSSDADQFPEGEVEVTEYFWDFDPLINSDTEDYDRDPEDDELSDDGDAIGQIAYFNSDKPGEFMIILTVWDYHHTQHGNHWETDQDTVIISIYDSLRITGTIGLSPTCSGEEDGKAGVLVTGGAPPIKVKWSTGQEDSIATGLKPGKYKFTVTDGLGTTKTGEVTVPEATPIIIDLNAIFEPLCPHSPTGIIDVNVSGGKPPYFYLWSNGSTEQILTNVIAGVYTVTVTDSNGCTAERSFVLNSNDVIAPTVTAQDAVIPLGPGGYVVLTPPLFQTVAVDNCTIDAIVLEPPVLDCTNLGVNPVTITAIDGAGNATSVMVTAVVLDVMAPVISAANVTLDLGLDGTATLTPAMVDAGTFDNCNLPVLTLDATNFDCVTVGPNVVTLTATDASGNAASATVTVTVIDPYPPVLTANDNITVMLDASGQASIQVSDVLLGASDNCGIATIILDQNVFSCNDLSPAEGIVEVNLIATDIHGNTTTQPVQVTIVDPIAPVITCPADIIVQYCGPVNYPMPVVVDNCDNYTVELLSGLGSGAVFPPGVHTEQLRVTDASGNSATCSLTVTIAEEWPVSATVQAVSCYGGSDGAVTPIITGGQAPYSYLWMDGQTGATASGLTAGTATVTLSDANGCTQVAGFDVPEPALLEASNSVQDETNSQANGSISLSAQGGTPPYTYDTQTFTDTLLLSGLAAGTYVLEISDANGCTSVTTAIVKNLVGVDMPDFVQAFRVYPVPTRQVLQIEVELTRPLQQQLRLLDISGRLVREWPLVEQSGQTIRLDCSSLHAGLYLVELRTEAGTLTRKAVVLE